MIRALLSLTLMALPTACAASQESETAESKDVAFYDYRVVNTFPHDADAFTQGLFFEDGALYESTGQYGESKLRETSLETGQTLRSLPLSDRVFAEGSTLIGNRIIVLTWRSGTGIVVDRESFKAEKTFRYDGEGWGLTDDGARLIMSDGTSELRFLDPETLQETGRLSVTFRGKPLPKINELEWVEGEIFANVWHSDAIIRIDPETGVVTGLIDMRGILPDEDFVAGKTDVLNGIAYDDETDRLFVTGKYWPSLFEIELTPKTADRTITQDRE